MTAIDQFLSAHPKVLVFGLGRQGGGEGDANYLASHGYQTRVTDQLTLDQLGLDSTRLHPSLELKLGGHDQVDIDWADLIIQNPGVPDNHPLLLLAKELGKSVVSSISLFVKYAPLPTIGVTGTRGKTTTTTLLAKVLGLAYPDQILVGGNLPGTSGLALFDQCSSKRYAILELSSFQLHSFHALRVSPTYAVVTNLYPDHLNRYPDMDAYRRDKEAICAYQTNPGFVVYNADNAGSTAIAKSSPVAQYGYHTADSLGHTSPLPGFHNQSNLAAVITLAKQLGIEDRLVRRAISSFTGVPYRQELVATHNGVKYVNDTTATTPTAARIALVAQQNPTILICGGESKKLPQSEFIEEITKNTHVKKVIILGSRNLLNFVEALKELVPSKIAAQVDSMAEAVSIATKLAVAGDTVLLSPGFASFDLFKNEFDRGDQFNACVRALA